jgi:hypothetical protein
VLVHCNNRRSRGQRGAPNGRSQADEGQDDRNPIEPYVVAVASRRSRGSHKRRCGRGLNLRRELQRTTTFRPRPPDLDERRRRVWRTRRTAKLCAGTGSIWRCDRRRRVVMKRPFRTLARFLLLVRSAVVVGHMIFLSFVEQSFVPPGELAVSVRDALGPPAPRTHRRAR